MAEKYGIISSLEVLKKGDQFEEFPLHVTLMTWFSMPHEQAFLNHLQNFAHRYDPQKIEGGDEAMFGPGKDVHVRKLGNAGMLRVMHSELLSMLTKLEGKVWSGGFVGEDYEPHVTFQGERGIDENEQLVLSRIQLIKGDVEGPRTVVSDLRLSNDHAEKRYL